MTKVHARACVIGGGVVGVSILYHLAKAGWKDSILLERTELTAGSTWHAAGLLPLFNMSYSVGQLHKYSVDLYKSLGQETGQDVGFKVTGNLRLATTQDRMDEYLRYCGTANTIGVPFEILSAAEVQSIWPLCNTDDLVGALFHPHDGYIQPADLTQALAIGARHAGASIHRNTEVTAIRRGSDNTWVLQTQDKEYVCEHVICATGNYARQTGKMVGLDLPIIPVEHQYIVTEDVPELLAYQQENPGAQLPVLRDSDYSYYFREERGGWILGAYEVGAPAIFADGVPSRFGKDLLPGDVDRLMPHLEAAFRRVPSFESAGIKDVINGPISYTPDGSPVVGPAWGVPNFWLCEGHSFGITAAGGAGWQLAHWITTGEPGIDMLSLDARRFGPYANKWYAIKKNEEAYANVFTIHYPDEERPAARPLKTSPIHDRLDQLGAVWGQRYGWERPNWFAPQGVARQDDWSFRRSQYWQHVANEHRHLREQAALIDLTGFSKFLLTGPGAEAWLNHLVCRKLPKRIGRVQLVHALNATGGVRSEFTVTREAEDRFYMVSSGAAERYDFDYLQKNLPADGSVQLENLTTTHGTLVLAGPRARDILAPWTEARLENEHFKWLTGVHSNVGCAPVRLLRVGFVGELGWEIHHPIEYQRHIFELLLESGSAPSLHGLGQCGMRAMDSLRIEKSYRMWGQDLTTEYSMWEAGLERFVHLDKGDFIGREALLRQQDAGVPNAFRTLKISGLKDADPMGSEPLWIGEQMIGRTTSGAFGHYLGYGLALAYIQSAFADASGDIEIEILGQRYPAQIIEESPHDPDNQRIRV